MIKNNNSYLDIDSLETQRIDALKTSKREKEECIILALVVVVIVICPLLILPGLKYLVSSFSNFKNGVRQKNYKDKYASLKRAIVTPILANINPTMEYKALPGVTADEIRKSGIREYFNLDLIKSEDEIVGSWHGRNFSYSELNLMRKDGDNDYHSIFKGQFYKIELSKNFSSTTIIRSVDSKKYIKPDRRVELEDESFSNMFVIESDSQVGARYVLSPVFMEKIKDLQVNNNFRTLKLSFVNGYLYLFIDNKKNLFDFDIKTSFYNQDLEQMVLDDLSVISEICEVLDLD